MIWLSRVLFLLLVPGFVFAQEVCADKKGGWKTVCLRNQNQLADEDATQAYWEVQNEIKNLKSPAYVAQMSGLLRKNEIDFSTYSESYCNMSVALAPFDVQLDRILTCSIQTTQLRKTELNRILENIHQLEAAQ